MAKIDGSVIVAKVLKDQGVDCVFTLTGGHVFRILQECQKLGIKVVDVRHETAAVHAAMAYGRATGKMGVVILTAGPGVMSGYTAFHDASLGRMPILILGGAAPLRLRGTRAMQEIDQMTPMNAVCKFAATVTDNKLMARTLYNAIREANVPPRGPVFVEIPADLLVDDSYLIDEKDADWDTYAVSCIRCGADPDKLVAAASMLLETENGALYMGEQMSYQLRDPGVFKELAEYLQFPIAAASGDLGAYIEPEHPLAYGSLAAGGMAEVILVFNATDDYVLNLNGPAFNSDATLIEVNEDPNELSFGRPATLGIVGTPDIVARQLLDVIKTMAEPRNPDESDWVEMLQEMTPNVYDMATAELEDVEDDEIMHPMVAVVEIAEFLAGDGADCNIISDGGDWCTYVGTILAMQMRHFTRPNRLVVGQNKLGGVGWGAGATTGLALATGHPILFSMGDGSLCEYLGEFFTYAKFGLPVVCVIGDNSSWNMIRTFADAKYTDEDNLIACRLLAADGSAFHYEELAKAWGGLGIYVEKKEDIIPALNKALAAAKEGKPSIVDIRVNDNIAPSASVGMAYDLYGLGNE